MQASKPDVMFACSACLQSVVMSSNPLHRCVVEGQNQMIMQVSIGTMHVTRTVPELQYQKRMMC